MHKKFKKFNIIPQRDIHEIIETKLEDLSFPENIL